MVTGFGGGCLVLPGFTGGFVGGSGSFLVPLTFAIGGGLI